VWCPDVIGRDIWDWVEREALRCLEKKLPLNGVFTRTDEIHPPFYEMIVECYCFLIIIMVDVPEGAV
jgi:hypothetical protein